MASKHVDLTQKRDFKNRNEKLKSISLKNKKDDYRRYHKLKHDLSTSTISSFNAFELSSASTITDTTSTLKNIFDNLDSTIMYVEERVCWHELYNDPDIYEQHYTHETWEEKIKNWNFPLGSKYDRLKTRYDKLREAEIQLAGYCDCCGRRINENNCLSYHYSICQRCNEMLYNRVESVKLH